jgi:hypothetical protein
LRQRPEQDEPRALNRGVQRCIGLFDWGFDENEPAQRSDWCGGGQHLAPLNIEGFQDLLVGLAARSLARALYLGKLRHIGIAQDKTDVWMRDKTPISVYHKGAAMTREFDLR